MLVAQTNNNTFIFCHPLICISWICSGLTSVYRSKAGGQDLEDDDDDDAAVDGDDDDTEINYRNNSHWKRAADCGLSNYVSYYDAASLYPSSGKNNNNNNNNKTLK